MSIHMPVSYSLDCSEFWNWELLFLQICSLFFILFHSFKNSFYFSVDIFYLSLMSIFFYMFLSIIVIADLQFLSLIPGPQGLSLWLSFLFSMDYIFCFFLYQWNWWNFNEINEIWTLVWTLFMQHCRDPGFYYILWLPHSINVEITIKLGNNPLQLLISNWFRHQLSMDNIAIGVE